MSTSVLERPADAASDSAPEATPAADDLAALAARMVATWPRLSSEQKAELGRLLAS